MLSDNMTKDSNTLNLEEVVTQVLLPDHNHERLATDQLEAIN